MILKGQRTPSKRLLEALRALEGRLKGGSDQNGCESQDEELRGVMELLRKLKESDPATFLAVKRVVETLAHTRLKSGAAASPQKTKAV